MTLQFSPFDSGDWDAFAGASKLPDGTGPFISGADEWTVLLSGDESGQIVVEVYGAEMGRFWQAYFPTVEKAWATAGAVLAVIESAPNALILLLTANFSEP